MYEFLTKNFLEHGSLELCKIKQAMYSRIVVELINEIIAARQGV
jgi:hypothetical protein